MVRGPPGERPVEARRVGARIHLAAERIGIYELSTGGDSEVVPWRAGEAVAWRLAEPGEVR